MKRLHAHEARLAQRRGELLARSAAQREHWQALARDAAGGLRIAERVARVAGWAREHLPLIGILAGLVLAWRGPRQGLALAVRAWSLWRGSQALRERCGGLVAGLRGVFAAAPQARPRRAR